MSQELVEYRRGELTDQVTELGEMANQAASAAKFINFRSRKAENTLRRHDTDLALFTEYLAGKGVTIEKKKKKKRTPLLAMDPEAWRGITWGLVEAFQAWMIKEGYAVSTVNMRISTVKTYARLAHQAGVLDTDNYIRIKGVQGFSRTEGKRVDDHRERTRRGDKKAEFRCLTKDEAEQLKNQGFKNQEEVTAQGRRDRLMLGLMIDLGLRVGEVALLKVEDIDLLAGTLTFYRPKVDKVQTHELINGLLKVARDYIEQDANQSGPLLKGSKKGGELVGVMSARAITKRVCYLGKKLGIENLSAHDLRHTWATLAAKAGTRIERLRDAGGWSSLAMPARYIEAAKVANEGVEL